MAEIVMRACRKSDIVNRVDSILHKNCKGCLSATIQSFMDIGPASVSDLTVVIDRVFQKRPNNPADCEMYVDLLVALHEHYPEFQSDVDGEKPCSVKRVLLNICQTEFEQMLTKLHREGTVSWRHSKLLGTVSFLGHLFVRNTLSITVVGQVVHDLIGEEVVSNECSIEMTCEFLMLIGSKLGSTPRGKVLMAQIYRRLFQLQKEARADGASRISMQHHDQIEELLQKWKSLWTGTVDLSVSRINGELLMHRRFSGKVKIHTVKAVIRELTGIPIVEQRIISDGRMLKAHDTLEQTVEAGGALQIASTADCSMVQSCVSELPRRIVCILNLPKTQEPKQTLKCLMRRLGAQRPRGYSFTTSDTFALISFKAEQDAQFAFQLSGHTIGDHAVEVKFLHEALMLPEVDRAASCMVDSLLDEMRREPI